MKKTAKELIRKAAPSSGLSTVFGVKHAVKLLEDMPRAMAEAILGVKLPKRKSQKLPNVVEKSILERDDKQRTRPREAADVG